MFVIVAPGQGAQKPGFLTPWLEHAGFQGQLDAWSSQTGLDLQKLGTESEAEIIKKTEFAQPLVVAAGLLVGQELLKRLPADVEISLSGHSVGEFTAACLGGLMSQDDTIAVVAERGRAMAEAASESATGMAAVLGTDYETLSTILDGADLFAANFNGAGQVVVAGKLENIEKFKLKAPAGTRIVNLEVAGAFHTPFMESAKDSVRNFAISLDTRAPKFPIYSNRDGERVTYENAVRYLIEQTTRPVRWDLCMQSFARDGVEGVIELPPAGTLAGLTKRSLKGVPTMTVNRPEDLDSIIGFVGGR
tara:strand:- start:671 stop:1585 length:915 start_codon:yes stop_codon:yes gene_type:complete